MHEYRGWCIFKGEEPITKPCSRSETVIMEWLHTHSLVRAKDYQMVWCEYDDIAIEPLEEMPLDVFIQIQVE